MAEKNSGKPDNSLSDEEQSLNELLAAALREEIARRRSSTPPRGLPNSRSESSLEDLRLPAYLTGFRIPQMPSAAATSQSSQSSQSSLQGAFQNLNFNRGQGSSTSTANDDNKDGNSEEKMETASATDSASSPAPRASTSGTNPFKENPEKPRDTEEVSTKITKIKFNFVPPNSDKPESSQSSDIPNSSQTTAKLSFSQSVDSLSKIKRAKSRQSRSLSQVTSEKEFLKATTPLKLRRSSRLISKGENLGIKTVKSKIKEPKFGKAARADRLKIFNNLFKIDYPDLSQILASCSPIPHVRNSRGSREGGKRALDLSPGESQPSKQSRTESLIKKQSQVFSIPPREQRVRVRSRTRGADESNLELDVSGASSHARVTPTSTPQQIHVATPRGAAVGANAATGVGGTEGATGLILRSPSHLMNAWPSATSLGDFNSSLSPPTLTHLNRHSNGDLNLSDVLNQNADPHLASDLVRTPLRDASLSDLTETKSSEESIKLPDIYPPRTLRGLGIRSKTSFSNLTGNSKKVQTPSKVNPGPNDALDSTLDPISKLMILCDNTDFTNKSTCPTLLSKRQVTIKTNNLITTKTTVKLSCDSLPSLTSWDSYLKSHDSNPFSMEKNTNALSNLTVKVNTNNVKVNKATNISTNLSQDQMSEPIYGDAMSIWRELRNALTRDVVLRMRLRNLQTMLTDSLVPKWSVTYNPPPGLLTNPAQCEHVMNVRRQIFQMQMECTIYLTERELEALKEKIEDLKNSLYALYQTKRGKQYNYQAALNQAVIQADRQRRATFEELSKRLSAIRQAPEEALRQGLPDFAGDTDTDVEEEPQPSTSAQAANPPRSRATSRWTTNQGQGQGQKRPRSRSQSNQKWQDGRSNQNAWVKVTNKKSKGKGKGKGKSSNRSNTNTNTNPQPPRNQNRSRDQQAKDELLDHLAAFFAKYNGKKPGNK